jgi:predicted MPP superfamily phosphohydrolase
MTLELRLVVVSQACSPVVRTPALTSQDPNWQYLTVDAGDWYAGSLFDRLGPHGNSSSVPELEYFLASGYDAVNLGNHDFDSTDKGLAHMLGKLRQRGLHLNILSSNIHVPHGPLADFVHPQASNANMTIRPYIIKTLAARDRLVRVGIVGLFGPDAALCSTSARGAATFAGFHEADLKKDYDELGAHARATVEHMREEEEADFVIALLHGGLDEAQEVLQRVPGIDVIASGHTHETYFASVPSTTHGTNEPQHTQVIQCSHSGRMLGQMRLYVDEHMKMHLADDPRCIDVDLTHGEDHHVSSLVRHWQTELPRILNSSFAYEQVVFRGRDGHVFNSSHSYIQHALTVSNLLLSQVNLHLRSSGIPEADVYLTCPTCVRSKAHSLNGEVVLQYSDIYRMLSISTQCDMVVFHMRKEDLWMVLNFVVILERVFSEVFVLTVGGVQYDVPAWGIPFVNYFSNLRLVRQDGSSLPYAEWPDLIRVATSTYVPHSFL